jgi:AcrR family transcriptional regulator
MAFGKPGRPPEDRLARQREIYEAVVPLIYRDGARRLSIREAARAAHMSVGGSTTTSPPSVTWCCTA